MEVTQLLPIDRSSRYDDLLRGVYMKLSAILTTSLALFAMFFGAGNVVFPLYVGLMAGEHIGMAMCGLMITAVALPILSLFAMVQFRGRQQRYFGRVGLWGGRGLLLLCLFLLGPFLVVPRTMTVAHAAISETLVPVSPFLFGIIYCIVILMLAVNAQTMLKFLSGVFTPLMLILLGALFIAGLLKPATPMPYAVDHSAFLFGLEEGYFTLDAIAALIFGQFVYVQLRQQQQKLTHQQYQTHVILATLFAGFLLGLVYFAMAFSAWQHGAASMTQPENKQALLILVTKQILPESWSGLSGVIIAVACLTTATALSKIFADYLHHYTRHKHWPLTEMHCLGITVLIALGMSLMGFSGLMSAFGPVIVAVYPVFILLAVHAYMRRWIPSQWVPGLAIAALALGIISLL